MRKIMSLLMIVVIIIGFTGCGSKKIVDVSMDKFCSEAINEITDQFDNFGDGDYQANRKLDWLQKYSKYDLNENQQEYYDMVKEMHSIFLEWQDAKIDNRENAIDTQGKRMARKFNDMNKFIEELE